VVLLAFSPSAIGMERRKEKYPGAEMKHLHFDCRILPLGVGWHTWSLFWDDTLSR
jgi:hypothetical protein